MTRWLEWSAFLAALAVVLPLAAGEGAIWGGFFQKDPDDTDDAAKKALQPKPNDDFEVVDSPEPDVS
jgi:hypothetical protein